MTEELVNYFIDEDALEIAEKNIFTATEVVTLKPVCGEDALLKFFSANNWVVEFLPNTPRNIGEDLPHTQMSPIKKNIEKVFNNRFGVWLDEYLMKITKNRWMKKESNHEQNIKGEPIGLKIGKHYARPNPEHLQKKIMSMIADKNRRIEFEMGTKIN